MLVARTRLLCENKFAHSILLLTETCVREALGTRRTYRKNAFQKLFG